MIEPTADDIGRRVVYRAGKHAAPEYGHVQSYNPRFVFVRYDGGMRALATPHHRLSWAGPRVELDKPRTVEFWGRDERGGL